MKTEDPAFDAGFKYIDQLVDQDVHDAQVHNAPLWYGWAVREAFWAGVEWQREHLDAVDEGE